MRLVLHVGAWKTGTSALQAGFVLSRETLALGGLWYPKDPYEDLLERGRVLSGNGLALAAHLTPRLQEHNLCRELPVWTMGALKSDLRDAEAHGCETVLYSSEYLASAPTDAAKGVVKLARELAVTVEVVYVVRDVLGHAISVYNQHVRQKRECGSIEDYVNAYRPPFLDHLARWADAVGKPNIVVIHYDSAKERLMSELLRRIGIDHIDAATTTVNASAETPNVPKVKPETASMWLKEVSSINEIFAPKPEPLAI